MRKLEKEEEEAAYQDPDRKVFHLCIVNLVIGTLYCAKGNFQVRFWDTSGGVFQCSALDKVSAFSWRAYSLAFPE